jgi:vacuolar-type H+-ATPase subunit I/STV1
MEIQKVYAVEDDVCDTTKEFYEVVEELCEQLKSLKMEQWELKEEKEPNTEFINAYDMVIQNKVWIFHKIVDAYSTKMKEVRFLEEKKEPVVEVETVVELPEVPTNVVSLS